MSNTSPEIQYDAEMPDVARSRFELFVQTLTEFPDTLRHILDQHTTNDALVEAAKTADQSTQPGQILALFGSVIEHGDENYVEPGESVVTTIGRVFDRAERSGAALDRQRVWYDALITHVARAKNRPSDSTAAAAITAKQPTVAAAPAVPKPAPPVANIPIAPKTSGAIPAAKQSGGPAVTKITVPLEPAAKPVVPEEAKAEVEQAPEPSLEWPIKIQLQPPDGKPHRAVPPILFMEQPDAQN